MKRVSSLPGIIGREALKNHLWHIGRDLQHLLVFFSLDEEKRTLRLVQFCIHNISRKRCSTGNEEGWGRPLSHYSISQGGV